MNLDYIKLKNKYLKFFDGNEENFNFIVTDVIFAFNEIKDYLNSRKYKNVKILWASVREPYNFLQAKQLGCHLITIPPKIIEKIENFGKSFSQLTKETVTGFLKDSKKSKFRL